MFYNRIMVAVLMVAAIGCGKSKKNSGSSPAACNEAAGSLKTVAGEAGQLLPGLYDFKDATYIFSEGSKYTVINQRGEQAEVACTSLQPDSKSQRTDIFEMYSPVNVAVTGAGKVEIPSETAVLKIRVEIKNGKPSLSVDPNGRLDRPEAIGDLAAEPGVKISKVADGLVVNVTYEGNGQKQVTTLRYQLRSRR